MKINNQAKMAHSPAKPGEPPVPVPAQEMSDWARIAGQLAGWLGHAAEPAKTDLTRFFRDGAGHTPDSMARFLTHIHDRIAVLLGLDPQARTNRADQPSRLVPVPLEELEEWGWLTGELTDWLHHAGEPIRGELTGLVDRLPDSDQVITSLALITDRIGWLLSGEVEQR